MYGQKFKMGEKWRGEYMEFPVWYDPDAKRYHRFTVRLSPEGELTVAGMPFLSPAEYTDLHNSILNYVERDED